MPRKPKPYPSRWYKKQHRIHPIESLANGAFLQFIETGEVQGILAFCDALAELDTGSQSLDFVRNRTFEERLRAMCSREDIQDVHFFFVNTAIGYNPKATSYAEAAVRVALQMREAELWYKKYKWQYADTQVLASPENCPLGSLRFLWDVEVEEEYPEYEESRWMCSLQEWISISTSRTVGSSSGWANVAEISDIAFPEPKDDPLIHPHSRIVQAELALEAMPLEIPRTTNPERVFNALLLTDFGEVHGTNPYEGHLRHLEGIVNAWTDDQRALAYNWAVREHLAASDNPHVERVKCPDHLMPHRRIT